MRSTCETSDRCQVSKRIPTSASPISSSACSIVETGERHVRLRRVDRLQRDRDAVPGARLGDPADALDHHLAVVAGTCQEEHAARLQFREPRHRPADRLDPRLRLLRAGDQRRRQDRARGRKARRDREPALAQLPGHVVDTVELELEDPDRPCPCRSVRGQLVLERGGEGRPLADPDAHHTTLNRTALNPRTDQSYGPVTGSENAAQPPRPEGPPGRWLTHCGRFSQGRSAA